jgi:hypothetical protein
MDAHEREYIAAASALRDQTPSPSQTFAVGDFISGLSAGRRWSGRVEWIEGDRITIDVGGGWLAVDARDVTH